MTPLSDQNRALLSAFGVDAPETVSEFRMMRETMDALLDAARAEVLPAPATGGEREAVAWRMLMPSGRVLRVQTEPFHDGFARMMAVDCNCSVEPLYALTAPQEGEKEGNGGGPTPDVLGDRAPSADTLRSGGEEFLEFKEALSDLRSLRHEYDCLNGGGPGWAARNAAAWAKVDELFANEDEAAYDRQQEDAHG